MPILQVSAGKFQNHRHLKGDIGGGGLTLNLSKEQLLSFFHKNLPFTERFSDGRKIQTAGSQGQRS